MLNISFLKSKAKFKTNLIYYLFQYFPYTQRQHGFRAWLWSLNNSKAKLFCIFKY